MAQSNNNRTKRTTYDTGGTGDEGEYRNKPTSRPNEGRSKVEQTKGRTRGGIWGALTNTK